MFEVPPPFDKYEQPVFVQVLISDDTKSERIFGTIVGGEQENVKVKVDTILIEQEGLNLEELKVRTDNPQEKDTIIVHAHKEDVKVDEERTKN